MHAFAILSVFKKFTICLCSNYVRTKVLQSYRHARWGEETNLCKSGLMCYNHMGMQGREKKLICVNLLQYTALLLY